MLISLDEVFQIAHICLFMYHWSSFSPVAVSVFKEVAKYSLYRKTTYHCQTLRALKREGTNTWKKPTISAPGGLVPASSSQIITIKFHVNKMFYCSPSENHWHEAIFLAYQISVPLAASALRNCWSRGVLQNAGPWISCAQYGYVSGPTQGERTVLSTN